MSLKTYVAALLGISTYQSPPLASTTSLDDSMVETMLRQRGGRIVPLPQNQTRWYLKDLEDAIYAADSGDLVKAGALWRACKRDGILAGILSTRTGGLVRLPKKFRGAAEQVEALQVGHNSVRSVFDEMFPPTELALLDGDGIALGVGVAELCEVKGRDYPVLRRLDPQWLVYRIAEDRWYYRSVVGLIPVTPGDGRWVLHIPGGRTDPWQNGIWHALGTSWVNKQHATMHVANWEGKLANPARVAISPQGASEDQEQSWFQAVLAWGKNTVFGMKRGYDVKLLESNGRGYESFQNTIERSEREIIVAIAGQSVTTDGGSGFISSDMFKNIRADLIQSDGDALAYTINTQGIPPWVVSRFGLDALDDCALVAWDTTPPSDRAAEAATYVALGTGIAQLGEALAPYKRQLDVEEILARFNIPVAGDTNGDGIPDEAVEAVQLPELPASNANATAPAVAGRPKEAA